MDPVIIAAVVWVICAILAATVANVRDTDPLKGFILGLILGPLGVLLTAIQKPPEPVQFD